MSKARKEAAKKKSIAQNAATRANKLQSAAEQIGKINETVAAQELLVLGTTALTNEEFTTAIDLLRQAIRMNPQNVDSFISLGLAYANLGQHDFALAACEMALKLDPQNSLALENREHALRALGLSGWAAKDLSINPRARKT